MSALIYKDWLIVAPQELLPPSSMDCSSRITGPNRDFFALSSQTYTYVPLLENLTIEKIKNSGAFRSSVDEKKERHSLHFLHSSGLYCVVQASDHSFVKDISGSAFDLKNLKKGDLIDVFGHYSSGEFLKGVLHTESDPHKAMKLTKKLWPDIANSYYAIPLSVFFEWMKTGAKDWPFQQYPVGVTTVCGSEKPLPKLRYRNVRKS